MGKLGCAFLIQPCYLLLFVWEHDSPVQLTRCLPPTLKRHLEVTETSALPTISHQIATRLSCHPQIFPRFYPRTWTGYSASRMRSKFYRAKNWSLPVNRLRHLLAYFITSSKPLISFGSYMSILLTVFSMAT